MDAPRYRWAALALIAGVTILRLVYLACWCPFDLAPDEAHYWDWSRQLDWCYYSKGPLVAWLIRASCTLLGDTMFAIRLPAVVCGSLLLLGLFTLAREVHQCDSLAFGMVALTSTLPIVAAGSLLMTIDAPFTCAWMWGLVFVHRAVMRETSWAWLGAGVCLMIGVLAKHTMILFVPSFALFLLTTPAMRHHLTQPGVWIMTGVGALGGVPILAWNLANDWVTFRHAQGHAGLDATGFHLLGPLKYLGGQVAILLGFWFVLWVWTMWSHRHDDEPDTRFLWWMSLPTFVFFGLFSFTNGGGEPNWPAPAYLSGMVLAAGQLAALSRQQVARMGVIASAALGIIVTIALHEPVAVQPVLLRLASAPTPERPMPIRRVDPTARLRGWRTLATEVDCVRAELRNRGVEPVLASERWTQAGELAFYCAGRPQVHCLGALLGDRHCQYDLWRPNPIADPQVFQGRAFILIGIDAERVRDRFDEVVSLDPVQYREHGVLIAQWPMAIGYGFHGRRVAPTTDDY